MNAFLNLNNIRSLNGLGTLVPSNDILLPYDPLMNEENALAINFSGGPAGQGCGNPLKDNQKRMMANGNALSGPIAEVASSLGWTGDNHSWLLIGAAAVAAFWFLGRR